MVPDRALWVNSRDHSLFCSVRDKKQVGVHGSRQDPWGALGFERPRPGHSGSSHCCRWSFHSCSSWKVFIITVFLFPVLAGHITATLWTKEKTKGCLLLLYADFGRHFRFFELLLDLGKFRINVSGYSQSVSYRCYLHMALSIFVGELPLLGHRCTSSVCLLSSMQKGVNAYKLWWRDSTKEKNSKLFSVPELFHHLSVSLFTYILKWPIKVCCQSSALLTETVWTCVKCCPC